MKRWVQEKLQKDKNTFTAQAKRHRHKSVGDVESTAKSKRQQIFSRVKKMINIYYYRNFKFTKIKINLNFRMKQQIVNFHVKPIPHLYQIGREYMKIKIRFPKEHSSAIYLENQVQISHQQFLPNN
jgi:hypothetical protein